MNIINIDIVFHYHLYSTIMQYGKIISGVEFMNNVKNGFTTNTTINTPNTIKPCN
jgi:hypothetical protein